MNMTRPIARSEFSDFLTLYFQGNITKCARNLGLSRPTIYKYLELGRCPSATKAYLSGIIASDKAAPVTPAEASEALAP